MSDRYYIQVRGKKQGPFTVERLRHMAKQGRFGRQHRVSKDGRRWKPADEFPELFVAKGERKQRQSAAVVDPFGAAAAAGGPPGAAGPGGAAGVPGVDPASVAPVPQSTSTWFYSHGGEQLGPVSMDVLKHVRQTGGIDPDDLVWTQGMEDWKPAEKALPGLFAADAQQGAAPAAAGGGPGAAGPAEITAHAPMCNLAIYSLLFAFIPVIGSIGAIICGHMALNEIDNSHSRMEGRNLAKAGLILGYVVLIAALMYGLYTLSSTMFGPPTNTWTPQLESSGGAGLPPAN